MLDYAANGVAYWPVERLQSLFDTTCRTLTLDPEAVLGEFLEDPAEDFWKRVKTNLQAGRIRLIFVADHIPPELQRVVEFLNTQMDPAEVLAVEIPRFSGSGLQTLVPRLIGQTESARSKKSGNRARTTGRQWDRASFLEALSQRVGAEEATTASSIMDWCQDRGLRASFGTGATSGSFYPVLDANDWYAPFALWTYGQVETQFQYLKARPEFADPTAREEMLTRFNRIPGVELPADGIERRPSFPISALSDEGALEEFFAAAEWIISQVRHSK
jgi:hypothetical protein